MYRLGEWLVDPATRRMSRGSEVVRLSPKAMDVLKLLHDAKGSVVSRGELLNGVWPDVTVGEEVLTHAIAELRKAFGETPRRPRYIGTVHKSGYRLLVDSPATAVSAAVFSNTPENPLTDTPPSLPDKPSIAVLPFNNLSDDPKQEYFADGIAEDIITALSRFHWFFVISRNSCFAYKRKCADVKNVARELGVRYVLEGSVRKSGARVRITTQLIDAHTDRHLWAERFDRDLQDIFAVQDEITERIITSVAPSIVSAEMKRAQRKDIASLDAWERIMRAHWHLAHFTMEDHTKARRLLTEAAQIEPDSALALGDLAMIYVFDGQWGWGISRDQSLAAAAEAARRAVAIDDSNVWGHIALGFVELFAGHHDESVRRLERAIEISPNDPHARGHLGFTLSFSGESQAAAAQIEKAILLSPRDPFLSFWYTALALAAFSAEQYEDAVGWSKKTIEENPDHPGAYRLLATSYAQLGHAKEAQVALKKMLHQMPGITITATRQQVPWRKPDDALRYLDGLRKAGLPE